MSDPENNAAYWAVIEHHHCWLAPDGCFYRQVVQDGRLTPEVARIIARDFRVSRTIGQVEGEGKNPSNGVQVLAEAINTSDWPDDLVDRAKICLAIANDHRDACARLNKAKAFHAPVSAVTKLMWFLRPEGWTMFDKYARIGLIGNKNDPESFYVRLSEVGFHAMCLRLNELCKEHGFPELWGERIIDKFLMLHGKSQVDSGETDGQVQLFSAMKRHYLELLPADLNGRLVKLASAVSKELNEETFPVWQRNPLQQRTAA